MEALNLTVALTGASGAVLGRELLRALDVVPDRACVRIGHRVPTRNRLIDRVQRSDAH